MRVAGKPAVRRDKSIQPNLDTGKLALPSWLAEDYVQLGEIDHSAEIAARMAALAARTNSARTDTRLRYLATQLAPHKDTASVADFFDAYQTTAHDDDG